MFAKFRIPELFSKNLIICPLLKSGHRHYSIVTVVVSIRTILTYKCCPGDSTALEARLCPVKLLNIARVDRMTCTYLSSNWWVSYTSTSTRACKGHILLREKCQYFLSVGWLWVSDYRPAVWKELVQSGWLVSDDIMSVLSPFILAFSLCPWPRAPIGRTANPEELFVWEINLIQPKAPYRRHKSRWSHLLLMTASKILLLIACFFR